MAYVYRYIDENDGIIKYVGIVYKRLLDVRIKAHASVDDWRDKGNWRVEYFECENRSVAEAFESHLISLYGTDKYYNKAKKCWGINKYLPDVESWWQTYSESRFTSYESMVVGLAIRKLIKMKKFDEASELLACIKVVE
ncbi:GIY-YIG nuclease family protein [Ruminococcus flavefaciens]|uniref:GIY-YIG nuclease family protein n=1 Tax=Ruminococcus flavefaciens TaxID=1265 RepID=UPI0026F18235|nr:GIY-YIG nuclease family protein [Ruminococcus flavefaciens]